jgi:hypothetical protein
VWHVGTGRDLTVPTCTGMPLTYSTTHLPELFIYNLIKIMTLGQIISNGGELNKQ